MFGHILIRECLWRPIMERNRKEKRKRINKSRKLRGKREKVVPIDERRSLGLSKVEKV